MSILTIRRWETEQDGPPNETKLRTLLEARGYSVARYTYSPGTRFPPHVHGEAKIDVVLEGTFRMGMHGQFVDLGPGDWLEVEPCEPATAREALARVAREFAVPGT